MKKLCAGPVRCCVRTNFFELWADGTLFLEGGKLSLKSKGVLFELPLADELVFEYAEPRELLGKDIEGVASGLGIALPLRLPVPLPELPPPRDVIFFLELSE